MFSVLQALLSIGFSEAVISAIPEEISAVRTFYKAAKAGAYAIETYRQVLRFAEQKGGELASHHLAVGLIHESRLNPDEREIREEGICIRNDFLAMLFEIGKNKEMAALLDFEHNHFTFFRMLLPIASILNSHVMPQPLQGSRSPWWWNVGKPWIRAKIERGVRISRISDPTLKKEKEEFNKDMDRFVNAIFSEVKEKYYSNKLCCIALGTVQSGLKKYLRIPVNANQSLKEVPVGSLNLQVLS